MNRNHFLKQIPLLISICVTVLFLTGCGDVIKKCDSNTCFGGKIPGITEEMMLDPKITMAELDSEIVSTGTQKERIDAVTRLTSVASEYKTLAGKSSEKLDQLVVSGKIVGYFEDASSITFYDYTGQSLVIYAHQKNLKQ